MHLSRFAYLAAGTLAALAIAAAVSFALPGVAEIRNWTEYPRLFLGPLLFDVRALPAHTLLLGLLLSLAALAALAAVVPTSWRRRGPGLWMTYEDRRPLRFGSWRPC